MTASLEVTALADMAPDEQAAAWAARLAEGRLTFDQEAAFEAWLTADGENGRRLDEIVAAWQAVEGYAAAPEVMAMRSGALEWARRAQGRRSVGAYLSEHGLRAAAAAVMVLAIGLGLGWMWLSPRSYETRVGERRVVALSDGSKLSLDGDTLVKVRYGDDARRLRLLRGRAKFEVAKDPLRPFSVAAGDKTVVATGTAFTVELARQQVRVVLYEGHVAVLESIPGGGRKPLALGPGRPPVERVFSPGEELVSSASPASPRAAEPVKIAATDPVRSLSWEGGQLVFDDEALPLAVERMNRYAAKPLRIGDAGAASLRISGVFRAGDQSAFVQGLQAAFGVSSQDEDDAVVLRRPRG